MTNRPNNDASHLVGWICAGALLFAFAIYLLWSGPGKAWLCEPGETACAREWLAALSGWAAIAAAVPTVWLLGRQIRDANRHHMETLMLQLQPTIALAQRIAEHAYQTQEMADKIIVFAGAELIGEGALRPMNIALQKLEELERRMSSTDYDDFESKVGSGQPGILHSVRGEITDLRGYITETTSSSERLGRFGERRERLLRCAEKSMQYSTQCADRASVFIEQWFRAKG